MSFPPKSTKKNGDEEFERFAEMLRPVFLRTRLTNNLKMPPYAKYMKDIITNKRKISEAEISMKEICPRGNNKVVIYISLYHDKCLLFMLELY